MARPQHVADGSLTIVFAVYELKTGEIRRLEEPSHKVKVDGKVSITRLFNDAIATARGSTVSLRYNSKSVMLGTVVSDKGHILTGRQRRHAAGSPIGPGADTQIRTMDVRMAFDIAVGRLEMPA